MSTKYLLIHRNPSGRIAAVKGPHPGGLFITHATAARAAEKVLRRSGAETDLKIARNFALVFSRQPISTLYGHGSGHDFRVLRADFTADICPVPIKPGMKVITNDLEWARIEPTQFMDEKDDFGPGGRFFDGWYLVTHEDGSRYTKFNGERLGTKKPE